MKKIGITGGIGVGKTYVSNILKRLNYPVYNSDLISKNLVNTNTDLIIAIKQEFGDDIYHNNLIQSSK